MSVPSVALAGHAGRIPQLGLGTWRLDGEECERTVALALGLGYRHIDTAEGYGNEREVGRGIAGADRSSLWITTKVWRQYLAPSDLRRRCEKSLRRLGTDYLDLYLVHWPNRDIPIEQTVDGFEALREDGLIRAWGVSNFTPTHMREACAYGTPATNQVELHPYFNQRPLVAVQRELGIPVTAYSPVARGAVLDDPVLVGIARAHDRTPAQVALRWAVQHGHIVIPKAATEAHLRDNLEVFGFELTPEEMRRIDDLPQGERLVDGEWSEFDR